MVQQVTKRCAVCGRFRAYEPTDQFCILCGHEGLDTECTCGRTFAYALDEPGPIHCPRCGKSFHGKSPEFE